MDVNRVNSKSVSLPICISVLFTNRNSVAMGQGPKSPSMIPCIYFGNFFN